MANFGQVLVQNGQFFSFPGKTKTPLFTLPKTSIHAKKSGKSNVRFSRKTITPETETVFNIVRIRPVGVRPKSENKTKTSRLVGSL